MMRFRGLLPERHDRFERQPVGAGSTERVLQLQRDLALCHPDRERLEDLLERCVRARLRVVEQRDLLRVLHPPEAFDGLPHLHELDVGRLVLQLAELAHRYLVRFEPQPADAERETRIRERLIEPVQVRHTVHIRHFMT